MASLYRGPCGPEAPHGFGPTALSEAVRRRLDAPALNALAELEMFDADAVVQCLEQAGATVRNPSAYVVKAVGNARRQLEGGGGGGGSTETRWYNEAYRYGSTQFILMKIESGEFEGFG